MHEFIMTAPISFYTAPLWQVLSMFRSWTKDFTEKCHNSHFLKSRLKRKCWWVNSLLSARMAAMHWEARRRQSLLDRRTARDKQQVGPALHPGRCQHLSFLKSFTTLPSWRRSCWPAALLYYWREQRGLESEQRHRHLGVGSGLFPVGGSPPGSCCRFSGFVQAQEIA